MEDLKNGSVAQSPEHFNGNAFEVELEKARSSGDFTAVIHAAKESYRMLAEFRGAVLRAKISGGDAKAVATGLLLLDQMVAQADNNTQMLRHSADAVQATPMPGVPHG